MAAESDPESFWELFLLNFKVKYRNLVDYYQTVRQFYPNHAFRHEDLELIRQYLWENPFKMNKEFLLRQGADDPYAYGETPLATLAEIAHAAEIKTSDTIFELGCGRGRGCFWLHSFCGCGVVGIDFVPEFIQKAVAVKEKCKVDRLEFRCEDMLQADFSGGTIFYLYGTCLEEEIIKKLIEKFLTLPDGTKIITVSYPLNDYVEKPLFPILKELTMPFTWGEGSVYIQTKQLY